MKIKEIRDFRKKSILEQKELLANLKDKLFKMKLVAVVASMGNFVWGYIFVHNVLYHENSSYLPISFVGTFTSLAILAVDLHLKNKCFSDVVEAETIMTLNEINKEEDISMGR